VLVNTLWEGTSIVLGLDVARVVRREPAALEALERLVKPWLVAGSVLASVWTAARDALRANNDVVVKEVLFGMGFVVCGALLRQYAKETNDALNLFVAREWELRLAPPAIADTTAAQLAMERSVAMGLHSKL
jgi:hypothetical protein